MLKMHILRVFTNSLGKYGGRLGVFLNGTTVSEPQRLRLARSLGYPELVFVDDAAAGQLRIYSSTGELPFAGHPLIGTAWLIRSQGMTLQTLRPPAGDVVTWREDDKTWIRARPEWSPKWEQIELESSRAVARLKHPDDRYDFTQFWAWDDRSSGLVRARVFAGRLGNYEDEACGSASMLLADRLDTPLIIRHGEGSVVYARPGVSGSVELGGSVAVDGILHVDE